MRVLAAATAAAAAAAWRLEHSTKKEKSTNIFWFS